MKPARVVALVVLALATVQAAPVVPLHVEHTAADYQGVEVRGGLAAWVEVEDPRRTNTEAAWSLTAEHVHVERDESTSAAINNAPQYGTTTTSADYPEAWATSTAAAGYSLSIWPLPDHPLPTLTIAASCLRASADATGSVTADKVVRGNTREARTASVDYALWFKPCKDQSWSVHVTGSFFVALWDWTTHIHHPDGHTHDWTSGPEPTNLSPDANAEVPGTLRRQTYLTITNGTLDYQGMDERKLPAFVTNLNAQADAVRFTDARREDAGGTLDVQGAISVTSARRGDRMESQIAGDLHAANFNNAPLSLATSTLRPSASLGLIATATGAFALAAFAAPSLGWTWTRRRSDRWLKRHQNPRTGQGYHLARAEYLHTVRDHRRALWHARRAAHDDPADARAWELRGRCHHALRQAPQAARCYEAAHRILRDEDVEAEYRRLLAYLISRAYGLQGLGAQASAWLTIAAHNDPSYLVRAVEEGDFGPVWDHPNFSGLRGSTSEWLRE